MARRPSVMRPVALNTRIPEDLYAQLAAYLYSPAEGRIPKGAFQAFICDRIREFFKEQTNVTSES